MEWVQWKGKDWKGGGGVEVAARKVNEIAVMSMEWKGMAVTGLQWNAMQHNTMQCNAVQCNEGVLAPRAHRAGQLNNYPSKRVYIGRSCKSWTV